MPVTYSIEGKLVRLEMVGEYEPHDVTNCFLQALADPEFPQPAAMLLDVSRSSVLSSRDPMQIRYVAQFAAPHRDLIENRCAVLVSSDINYSQTRLGAVFSESVGIEAGIFRDEATALKWLGVKGAGD